MGICVIVLIILALMLYRKLRITQRRLEYEVKDVRNVAQISTAIELPVTKKENYGHLMTSDDGL
jgi:hypothetical protein